MANGVLPSPVPSPMENTFCVMKSSVSMSRASSMVLSFTRKQALSGYSVREEKVNLWRCRNCVQIKITGGGSVALPSGVAFPGAYQPNDPGILIQLWTVSATNPAYTIPGGPILYGNGAVATSAANGSSSTSRPSSSTSSTRASSFTSSTRASSASSSTRASSTSSAASAGQTLYGQ
ncbi:hypothetical protein FRB91_007632, partial [Serendipita sp. 411]